MNDFIKGVVFMAVVVYMVSPIDAAPGPVDDLLVALLGLAAGKRLTADQRGVTWKTLKEYGMHLKNIPTCSRCTYVCICRVDDIESSPNINLNQGNTKGRTT